MKKRLLSTILALCMIMTIIPIMPIVSSAAEKPTETRSAAVRAASEGSAETRSAGVETTTEGTNCNGLLIIGGTYGTDFSYSTSISSYNVLTFKGNAPPITIRNVDPTQQVLLNIQIECTSDFTLYLDGVNLKADNDHKYVNRSGIKPAINIAENLTSNVTIFMTEGSVNRVESTLTSAIRKNGREDNIGWLYLKGKGTLYATGGQTITSYGAGIGGYTTKNIEIDGPTIYAVGGPQCAGIGGESHGSGIITAESIIVRSGTVFATGGEGAAAIGSGFMTDAKNIQILGGTVKAIGGEDAAGIGASHCGSVDGITISGGTIEATGFAGIGCGAPGTAAFPSEASNITISGGSVNANVSGDQPTNGAGENVYLLKIPNPEKKDVFVNGNKWNPCNSSALDDTNLYLYVPLSSNVTMSDTGYHHHFVDGAYTTDIWETKNNDQTHWQECTVCHIKKDEANHTFAENGVCSVCSREKEIYLYITAPNNKVLKQIRAKWSDKPLQGIIPSYNDALRVYMFEGFVDANGNALSTDLTCGELAGGNTNSNVINIFTKWAEPELVAYYNGDIITEADCTYVDGVLTIRSAKAVEIKNRDDVAVTNHRIVVAGNTNAKITLAGVNIDVSAFDNQAALSVGDGDGDVTITIKNVLNEIRDHVYVPVDNTLISGKYCAGIAKTPSHSTLTICGTVPSSPSMQSKLIAKGGRYGAGIGGSQTFTLRGLTIDSAYVIATGGDTAAGIGGSYGSADNIQIKNSRVIANGDIASIGGYYNARNITITNSVVTATDGIGGHVGTTDAVTIVGGSVKASAYGAVTNGTQSVYPLIIPNPVGDDVYIDGVKWTPSNHATLDSRDGNLYLWLPGKDTTVTVGEQQIVFSFSNGAFGRLRDLVITSADTLTEGTDYEWDSLGTLTVKTSKAVTISMRDGVESTNNTIAVAKDVDANITLAGVNIDVLSTGGFANGDWIDGQAAFYIADNSKGNVTITLAAGTTNILQSGTCRAGLEKNGNGDDIGRLTIQGTGTLKLESAVEGAGIGGRSGGDTRNIVIKNGTILPTSAMFSSTGAFIGGGAGGDGIDITIDGGTIFDARVYNTMGAVIGGGGRVNTSVGGGDGRGITVNGGTINVKYASDQSAIIGGGDGGVGEDITINGGTIIVKDRLQNGSVIGGGNQGEGRNIRITGGKLSFELKWNFGAGIGGGASAMGKNITITGGTITITATEWTFGASIGGGGSAQSEGIVITGGSILLTRADEKGQAIGSGYQADPTYPTNGDTANPKNVYLITLPNPDGKDIYIDGVKWTPSNHTALDASDTNLYAYISGEKHVIKIGSDEAVWHFDSATQTFLKTDCVDNVKDHFCDYCGDKLSDHKGGEAKCNKKAICDYCGNEYGDVDKTNHAGNTEVRGNKDATCTDDGYTGDTYCKDCGEKISDGQPIKANDHTDANKDHICDVETCKATISSCKGGTATCKSPAVCDYCQKPYGDVDKTNHAGNTEVRGNKDATCTDDGYTGDTYCKDCDTLLDQGTPINALGHIGGEAKCDAQAICTVCGKPYGDVDKTKHTGEEIWIRTADTHAKKWSCCGTEIMSETAHDFDENGDCICGTREFIFGDANGDGTIDCHDVILVKKYIANYDAVLDMSSVEVYPGADMNNDGKINCHDVIMMKKYIANMSNQ